MTEYIRKINFLKEIDILEPIQDSQSGATVLKVMRGKETFFLKIMDNSPLTLENIKEIVSIYTKHTPKAMQLITSGTIENKIYCIYSWIDGKALNTLYDTCSKEQFYTYGVTAGNYFKEINEKEPQKKEFEKREDIDALTQTTVEAFTSIYNKNYDAFSKVFSRKEIEHIIDRLYALKESFKDCKKEYIHGDMHPKNMMVEKEHTLTVIDIESFCFDYFVMNFRWSIASAFNRQENAKFFDGFIQGVYENHPPKNLYNQLLYLLLLRLLELTITYDETKEQSFVIEYLIKAKKVVDYIQIDLNNHNFLQNDSFFKS